MATIITRETGTTAVNRTLTNTELDNNFINLNADIGTRILSSEKAAVNGVATLDATGKVPATQLPSYVDDVQEAANLAAFPATGETGKIYVALDTNKAYRWSGSVYVYITSGAVDSVAGRTGVVVLTKSDVGLASADNTADSSKNVLSATKWTTARTISITGDLTGSVSVDGTANVSIAGTLPATGVSAGSYGSATAIPVFTVDAKGRITAASTSAITVGNGALSLSISTGSTNTAVSVGTGTGFTANSSNAAAYTMTVGPALVNLATLMTTAGAGFIRRGATADSYTIDTNTYLTAEADTLATVTGRGASTSTAVTLSNAANHYSGHFYYDAHDAAGNHYPHFNDGGSASGTKINWRLYTGVNNTVTHTWTTSLATFATNIAASNFSGSSSGTNTGDNAGVTSVGGTAPVVSSGGTTPVISMAAATASVNGYLTAANWTTFNNKQPAGSYLTDAMRDRGGTTTATVDTATLSGFYNQANSGDSHSLLVFNPGGSTAIVQQRFHYTGSMEFRNKTDSANWNSWKTVLTSSNVGTYAVTSIAATSPIVTSAAAGAITLSHAASGVGAGTYNNVTVNATGHVTAGSNAGYLTGESDTLSTVATRGNSYINASLGGISIGEAFANYEGWSTQLNVHGVGGHSRVNVKTDTVRMGVYAHNSWNSVSGVAQGGFVGTYNNYPLSFLVNTTQVGVFNTSGNFGLGITSPTARIHVVGLNSGTGGYTGIFENSTNGTNNGGGYLFQNNNSNHSWGTVAEFRTLTGAAGGDRPSVIFSSDKENMSWSVGFVSGTDSTFRITKNHGHRAHAGSWEDNASGWGTPYLTITTAGVVNATTTLQQGGNQVLHAGNYTSYAAASNHNHQYNVNNDWLRDNNDDANVKLYGNTRQMAFRTDGATEYATGVGGYPFAWMYGGDTAAQRLMLLNTTGDMWTSTNGWLSTALAGKQNTGSYLTAESDTLATVTARGNTTSTALTLSGAVTLSNTGLFLNRSSGATTGISWYSSGYTTWSTYMAPAAATGVGPTGNITAPSGTLVTAWALRNTVENATGYGWTWESGTSSQTTPTVVAEIRSSDGAMRIAGAFAASNFSGSSSGTNTGDNPGVTSVAGVTPIVSSGGTTPSISHATSGATAGTYNNVTVNTFGHVTSGSNVGYTSNTGTVTSVATSGGYGGLTLTGGTITTTGTITMGGTPTGTWPISVSGNAATATNSSQLNGLSKVQLWNNSGNGHSTYQTFAAIPDFGVWYMQNSSAADTPQSGSQYYVQTQGLGNDYAYSSYALMTAVARDHALKYTYYRAREGGTWGSWSKGAAGYADTAGSAGSATYATSASRLYSTDASYAYGSANPYYGYLTYTGSRWRFQVSPASPAAVEVAYADTAGSATDSTKLPLSGGTMTGNIGLNDTKLMLRGASDTNHYLWNNASDYEEMVYYTGTGFRVTSSTGTQTALFSESGLTVGRDLYISGQTGGNYGNRLIVGATTTAYTLQDTNIRPTIQVHGAYPVLSLNHTANTNASHGPTIQFTANGAGNQFVIGMNGTGTQLDFGYSSTADWNPHNGINNYSGTTALRITSAGAVNVLTALQQGGNQVLHASNYTSYSPTLTGGGASGTWGINVTGSAGSLSLSNGFTLTAGASSYGQFSNWVYLPGSHGFYSGVNSAHFYPNDASSYGAWHISGTRNGWNGLSFAANNGHIQLMVSQDSNETGFHNNSYGWQFRWSNGTLYCHKNSYGAGVGATVLDSSNYNSYSPTLTGGSASGTWGISITGNAASATLASSVIHSASRTDTAAYPVMWGSGSTSQLYSCAAVTIQSSTGTLSASILTATSDIRVKTNIKKIDNALDKVMQLRGVTYDRTDIEAPRQTGVIAQEVLEVLPEAVTGSEETQYGVAYGNMVGLLIEAIKDQQTIIDSQESRIAKLEILVAQLIEG